MLYPAFYIIPALLFNFSCKGEIVLFSKKITMLLKILILEPLKEIIYVNHRVILILWNKKKIITSEYHFWVLVTCEFLLEKWARIILLLMLGTWSGGW